MPSFPDPICLHVFLSCQPYFHGGHLVYSQKPSDLFPEVTRKRWLVYIIQGEPCRWASVKSWLPRLGLEPWAFCYPCWHYQLSYSGPSKHIHQFTLTTPMWSCMPSCLDPICLHVFPSCQPYFHGGHLVYSQKPSDLFPEVIRDGRLVYIIQGEPSG